MSVLNRQEAACRSYMHCFPIMVMCKTVGRKWLVVTEGWSTNKFVSNKYKHGFHPDNKKDDGVRLALWGNYV